MIRPEASDALLPGGLHQAFEVPGFRIVTGRGTLVLPGVQACAVLLLDLNAPHPRGGLRDQAGHPGAPARRGAQLKVGDDYISIANAARRCFLDQQSR
ncbi:hypothetical protein ACU686_23425 [Yinghuangia aomiensis]